MFTNLNLTLSTQLTPENDVLPALPADALPLDGEVTDFARSLDGVLAETRLPGKLLPLGGGELPVDIRERLTESTGEDLAMPLPVVPLRAEIEASAVAWPAGLVPTSTVVEEDDLRLTSSLLAADDEPALGDDAMTGVVKPAALPQAAILAPAAVEAGDSVAERPVLPGLVQRTVLEPNDRPTIAAELWQAEDGDARAPLDGERTANALRPELTGAVPAVRPGEAGLSRVRLDALERRLGTTIDSVQSAPLRPALATAPSASGNAAQTTVGTASTSLPAIATPVGEAGWGDDMADRVLMLTNTRVGNAEIRLTPAELGPVRVQVSVDDGTASVAFQATQAATREAIEQMLPRLRDMLADSGLALGQTSVDGEGVRDGGRESADGQPAATADAGVDTDVEPGHASADQPQKVSNGLVDTFA
jgi:flagellar hook-length control protein FliK